MVIIENFFEYFSIVFVVASPVMLASATACIFCGKATSQAHFTSIGPAKITVALCLENYKVSYVTVQKFQCVLCAGRYSNFLSSTITFKVAVLDKSFTMPKTEDRRKHFKSWESSANHQCAVKLRFLQQ